jgi:hypothetical protein
MSDPFDNLRNLVHFQKQKHHNKNQEATREQEAWQKQKEHLEKKRLENYRTAVRNYSPLVYQALHEWR